MKKFIAQKITELTRKIRMRSVVYRVFPISPSGITSHEIKNQENEEIRKLALLNIICLSKFWLHKIKQLSHKETAYTRKSSRSDPSHCTKHLLNLFI